MNGKLVLLAGATSASGLAAARVLAGDGARVVAVGRHRAKLAALADAVPDARLEVCDLADEAAVVALAERIHATDGRVDGVLHLVGGWRGGGGVLGQTEEDYRVLERSFTALRHVSRAFWNDLVASPAGRIAIVSSTTVASPVAGSANYTSVKAASESWMRSLAQGFAKAGAPAAAVVFRITSLAGLEDRLAASVVALWGSDAATLNASTVELTAG